LVAARAALQQAVEALEWFHGEGLLDLDCYSDCSGIDDREYCDCDSKVARDRFNAAHSAAKKALKDGGA